MFNRMDVKEALMSYLSGKTTSIMKDVNNNSNYLFKI